MVGFYVAVNSDPSLQSGGYGPVAHVWRHELVYCHFFGHAANGKMSDLAGEWIKKKEPGNYAFVPPYRFDIRSVIENPLTTWEVFFTVYKSGS